MLSDGHPPMEHAGLPADLSSPACSARPRHEGTSKQPWLPGGGFGLSRGCLTRGQRVPEPCPGCVWFSPTSITASLWQGIWQPVMPRWGQKAPCLVPSGSAASPAEISSRQRATRSEPPSSAQRPQPLGHPCQHHPLQVPEVLQRLVPAG